MTTYIRKTARDAHPDDDLPVSVRHAETRHLPKDQPAADRAMALGLVMSATENLLLVQQSSTGLRGYMSVFGLGLVFTAPFAFKLAAEMLGSVFLIQGPMGIVDFGLGAFLFVFTTGGIFTALRFFRVDLLTPTDNPLVFNRKTRKVYRVMPAIPERQGVSPAALVRHWLNTFRPWPMQVIEYDWDCLEAEYFSKTLLAGNVVRTEHHLWFYVKASPGSDQVLGSFGMVPPLLIREDSAMMFWEHIRRFMQENGPPLPPGETPAPKPPRNPISALNTVLPYAWPLVLVGLWWGGGKFVEQGLFRMSIEQFMRKADIGIFEFGVAFLSSFGCAAAFFNWIGHLLAPRLKLPPEVLQEAGAPVDLWALQRQTKHLFGQRTGSSN